MYDDLLNDLLSERARSYGELQAFLRTAREERSFGDPARETAEDRSEWDRRSNDLDDLDRRIQQLKQRIVGDKAADEMRAESERILRPTEQVSGDSDWVEQELLPAVSQRYGVTFTSDPEGRATMGGSSGAACAWTMAGAARTRDVEAKSARRRIPVTGLHRICRRKGATKKDTCNGGAIASPKSRRHQVAARGAWPRNELKGCARPVLSLLITNRQTGADGWAKK